MYLRCSKGINISCLGQGISYTARRIEISSTKIDPKLTLPAKLLASGTRWRINTGRTVRIARRDAAENIIFGTLSEGERNEKLDSLNSSIRTLLKQKRNIEKEQERRGTKSVRKQIISIKCKAVCTSHSFIKFKAFHPTEFSTL